MKYTFARAVHILFYMMSSFVVIAVLTMPIPLNEKIIHSFAWFYLLLLYAFFFDESPPRFLQIDRLYGSKETEGESLYLDHLLGLSQYSLSLMRKIQLHSDMDEVNQSILELKQKYNEIKRLTPPREYSDRHKAIVEEIRGFLDGLNDGEYRLVQAQTN